MRRAYLTTVLGFVLGFMATASAEQNSDHLRSSIHALLGAHERALPAAGEARAAYRDAVTQAERLRAEGEDRMADTILDQTYQRLTLAIRTAKQEPGAAASARADADREQSDVDANHAADEYSRRRHGIETMLEVLRRDSEDEADGAREQRQRLSREIETGLKTADALRATDPAAALAMLDRLYEQEKIGIRGIKENDANKALGNATTATIADPEKTTHDFDRLSSSVDELLNAQQRILDAEFPGPNPERQVGDTARALQAEARTLQQANQPDSARATLRQSYDLIQHSVMRLREGKTLIRSLDFDSAEEEYEFEVQRHAMHLELADLLLRTKRSDPAVGRMSERVLTRSERLRQQAQEQAEAGDHSSAVDTLEQASSEIYKLFRVAGIYVPD